MANSWTILATVFLLFFVATSAKKRMIHEEELLQMRQEEINLANQAARSSEVEVEAPEPTDFINSKTFIRSEEPFRLVDLAQFASIIRSKDVNIYKDTLSTHVMQLRRTSRSPSKDPQANQQRQVHYNW